MLASFNSDDEKNPPIDSEFEGSESERRYGSRR